MVDFTFASATLLAAMTAGSAPTVTSGWNGVLGTVDLAKPQDYTGEKGKICVSDAGAFQLRETLAYYAYICAGSPTAVADFEGGINDAFAGEYFPLAAEIIARYRIYAMFNHAGTTPAFRATDRAKWPLKPADLPNAAALNDKAGLVADEVYALFTANEASEAPIGEMGRMVLLGILAGAIHRKNHEGHSWFTAEMSNPRSQTAKYCAIAGQHKKAFMDYQKARGHEGPHHLADATIDAFALVIGQVQDKVIPSTIDEAITYNGEPIRGRNLKDLFFLGEATKGRYPPGILGAGAIITGMELCMAVLTDIGTKVKLSGHEMIATNASKLSAAVKKIKVSHEKILELAAVVGPSLAWVWGYAETAKIADEADYIALANHAKRHIAQRASGVSCAKAMKRVTPHRQAMEGVIVSSLAALADMLAAAGSFNLAARGQPDMPLVSTMVAIDTTKMAATVGTQRSPDVFYDASD